MGQEDARTEATAEAFDADVRANQGYRYTVNAPLSSTMANARLTDLTLKMVELGGRSVIDVGCGDGTFTQALFKAAGPARMVGVDAAQEAIALGRSRFSTNGSALTFDAASVYELSYAEKSFDVAIVRGLLHHLQEPARALERIGRVARVVFIIEPNGYNPVLKVIEKASEYHRAHAEKSYLPMMLRHWAGNLGWKLERDTYAGLVPFFCPDWMAKGLKLVEPLVEFAPLARQSACAVYAARFRTGD